MISSKYPDEASAEGALVDVPDTATDTPGAVALGTTTPPSPRYAATIESRARREIVAGTPVGEYQITGLLGRGGMGEVYAAVQPLIGKRVAIKVLADEIAGNPEATERFVREARAVNEIRHPNIVDIFSFGELDDGRSYFVMELLEGESLGDRLERGPLEIAEAVDVLDQVLAAVEAAHRCDIIHRDLKPDNIFLATRDDWGRAVKLLDFGIAKLESPLPEAHATRTGVMMGTPLYMPPEQATGRDISPAVDVYAAGGVAYAMFCGRPPFVAPSAAEIISMHLHQAPAPPRRHRAEIPPGLDQLVTAMLAKDPADRPGVDEIRRRLAELRAGGLSPAPSRRWWMAAAAGVLAAAAALAIATDGSDEVPLIDPLAAAVAPPPEIAGGTIVLELPDIDEATVTIDGVVATLPDGGARLRYREDGVHSIAVTAPGREPFERRVAIAGGEVVKVSVTLAELPDRAPPARRRSTRKRPRPEPAASARTEPEPSKPARPRPRPRDPDAPINDPFAP